MSQKGKSSLIGFDQTTSDCSLISPVQLAICQRSHIVVTEIGQVDKDVVAQSLAGNTFVQGFRNCSYRKGRALVLRLGQERLKVAGNKEEFTRPANILVEGTVDDARVQQLFGGVGRFLPGKISF